MNIRTIATVVSVALAGLAPAIGADVDANKPKDVVHKLLGMEAPTPDWREVIRPYSADRMPSDDAPIEVLLAFWSTWAEPYSYSGRSCPRPTAKVQARLLEEVIKRPRLLYSYSRILPETPKAFAQLKTLYDRLGERQTPVTQPAVATKPAVSLFDDVPSLSPLEQLRQDIHNWLLPRSLCFRDELIAAATNLEPLPRLPESRILGPTDLTRFNSPLPVLARLDWQAAEPILRRYADSNSPAVAADALAVLYRRAIETGDQAGTDKLRHRLRELAEDPKSKGDARGHAVEVLMSSAWTGRDEWFASLFGRQGWDDGLLARTLDADPNHLIPIVAKLVASKAPAVRDSAIACLIAPPPEVEFPSSMATRITPRKEALMPLLAWLGDPNRSDQPGREELVAALSKVDLPESVPGLLWILRNETDDIQMQAVKALGHQRAKQAVPDLLRILRYETGDIQMLAAEALGRHRAKQAGPDLWKLFEQGGLNEQGRFSGSGIFEPFEYETWGLVKVMLACSAITDERIAQAVEAYLRKDLVERKLEPVFSGWGARERWGLRWHYTPASVKLEEDAFGRLGLFDKPKRLTPQELTVKLGRELSGFGTDHDFARATEMLLARARAVREKEPLVAQAIMVTLAHWQSSAIDRELAGLLGKTVDISTVLSALTRLEQMRKNVPKELAELVRAGGPAAGVAAAILAEPEVCQDMLRGKDRRAQLMLLASARLIRTPLPVDDVAALWKPDDAAMALACDRYLESDDSRAAREVVWAHYPGKVRILGAWYSFNTRDSYFDPFIRVERQLVKEMRKKKGPDEMIALIDPGHGGTSERWVIRCRAGRRVLTFKALRSRNWSRDMTPDEYQRLSAMMGEGRFDDLPPLVPPGGLDGAASEYVHLTSQTGRRVLIVSPQRGHNAATPYDLLVRFFRDLEP